MISLHSNTYLSENKALKMEITFPQFPLIIINFTQVMQLYIPASRGHCQAALPPHAIRSQK